MIIMYFDVAKIYFLYRRNKNTSKTFKQGQILEKIIEYVLQMFIHTGFPFSD